MFSSCWMDLRHLMSAISVPKSGRNTSCAWWKTYCSRTSLSNAASTIFLGCDSRAIGLKLAGSVLSPFLWMSIIVALFHCLGIVPILPKVLHSTVRNLA
eukprot:IDg9003t1